MKKEISGLKREIKRTKLFEVQRLVRRIRQLENKKGTEAQMMKNQRKVERFEKELEFLKDVGVDEIARRIAKKENEDDHENNQAIEDSHVDIDLQKRALERIVNSTKIKEFLKRVDASSEDSAHAKEGSSVVKEPRLKKQQKLVKGKLKTKRTANRTSVLKSQPSKEAQKDENVNVYVEKPILKKQQKSAKVKLASISEPPLHIDDKDGRSSDDDPSKLKNRQNAIKHNAWMSESPAFRPLVKKVDEDDGLLPGSDLSESDFEEDDDDMSSPELKSKGLESCFVETMSGLKEEKGLRGRNKQGKGKGKLGDIKGKRNRKGQRARQQMWEKVHGKGAKHLHKSKTETKSKEKFNNKGRKQTLSSNFKVQHSLKRKNEDETLHPSWEAMRKKRSQETLKVEFKGQKIKFDDSD